jgi:hypothetical protein
VAFRGIGLRDGSRNSIHHRIYWLMSPKAQYLPSSRSQSRIVSTVASDVYIQLDLPPLSVRLRLRPMDRAAMPKAAVDEDRHPLPRKHDIRTTPEALERGGMLSEPESKAMEP